MFDLFGADPRKIDQANQSHAVNFIALALVLFDKGIMTSKEFDDALLKATHIVEEEWARKREEVERDFDEKYPNARKMLSLLIGSQTTK